MYRRVCLFFCLLSFVHWQLFEFITDGNTIAPCLLVPFATTYATYTSSNSSPTLVSLEINTATTFAPQLSTFPNVTSISSLHVWELTTNHWVGSVKVLISEEGNEQKIKLQVINVLKELGVTDPCVQIDRDVVAGY